MGARYRGTDVRMLLRGRIWVMLGIRMWVEMGMRVLVGM